MLGRTIASLPDPQMTIQRSGALASSTAGGGVHLRSASPLLTIPIQTDKGPGSHPPCEEYSKVASTNISVSHRVMLWPAVLPRLLPIKEETALNLHFLATIGSPWLLEKDLSRHTENLPCVEFAPYYRLRNGAVMFSDLSVQQVNTYSAAYFNTYNRLFPLLDADLFMDKVIAKLLRQGYKDGDPDSVLALLVIALGRLAHDGVLQHSTPAGRDEHSRFRGGTIERPFGLDLFNEARRRLGLLTTRCCLEKVQVLLLEATYFEACARHAEFWSSVSAACMSCMFLIQSRVIDWRSQYGDLVKRAFWVCLLHERPFNLEFGVAATGIEAFADLVPMPHFPEVLSQDCHSGTPNLNGVSARIDSHYAFHFSAMISLGRLTRRADDAIKQYEPLQTNFSQSHRNMADHVHRSTSGSSALNAGATWPGGDEGPPLALIQALVAELDSWRSALPKSLQWNDESRFDFERFDPRPKSTSSNVFNFLAGVGTDIINHNVDIAVAYLRTCFYQARFLIYRPFVYKAFHDRSQMTTTDRSRFALAINAACSWPTTLSPPNNKKHLIPHHFSWTQNFLATLLVLQVCQGDGYLSRICRENEVTETLIENSIISMKAWLEDVSQADGIAEWALGMNL
jgi:hypothetical protein